MARRTAAQPVSATASEPLVEPQVEAVSVDALAQILEAIEDASGYEVMIYELDQAGRHMLQRAGLADFDIWGFAERFGGGDYELRTRDVRTKVLGPQRRFSVSKRVPRRDVPTAAQPATAAAGVYTGDRTIDLMLAMMKQSSDQAARSAEQQTQLLTALIQRPQQDNGLKFGDVIQAATLLAGKSGGSSGITELLDGVQKIQELAGTAGGGSDEVEVMKAFAPALTALLSRGAAQPQQAQPQRLNAGGVAAAALPAAQPAPSPQTTPAQAPAADTHDATPTPLAGPSPLEGLEPDRMRSVSAAIDTIAAIALRIGLATGGAIDSAAAAQIAHQIWNAVALDALDDTLKLVQPGELWQYIVGATPEILREQMQVHEPALRQIEGYLREAVEADRAQNGDDGDDDGDPDGQTEQATPLEARASAD